MWGLPSVTHSRFRRTAALLVRAAHGPVSLRKQQPQNCRNLTLSCGLFWSGGVARFGVEGCNFNTNLLQIRRRLHKPGQSIHVTVVRKTDASRSIALTDA